MARGSNLSSKRSLLLLTAVALTGCADNGLHAAVVISPNVQDFGSSVAQGLSEPVTFTITNTGTAPTEPIDISVSGVDAASFVRGADTCAEPLKPGASCSLTVRFHPVSPGSKAAHLLVMGAPGGSATASLYGAGQAPGLVDISPTPQDLGAVVVNSVGGDRIFTITNTGDVDTGPLAISLTGADATQFSLGSTGTCVSGTTALLPRGKAGSGCTILVHFSPTSAGAMTASLSVTPAGAGQVTAALTGTGVMPAQFVISPNLQDFGQVVIGKSSGAVDIVVKNNGGVPTTDIVVTASGAQGSQFAIVAGGCAGSPLAAGASCTLTVRFAPTAAGSATATLDVTAGTNVKASATFKGQGITPAQLTLTPASPVIFDPTPTGGASAAVTFTITNTGTAPTGTLIAALSGTNAPDFQIVPDANGCRGAVLDSAGACTITLVFAPSAIGAKAASLTVSGNPGGSATSSLSGVGLAPAAITLSPTGQDFGSVGVGARSGNVSFTISNSGSLPTGTLAAVVAGLGAQDFVTVANGCTGTLAPAGQAGSSCTLTLAFGPTSRGAKNASLEVSASPGGAKSIPLAGLGIGAAELGLSGSFNFGNVTVGQSAANQYTVTNLGAAPTGVLTLGLSGTNANEFSIVGAGGTDCVSGTTTLAGFPGAPAVPASCTVRVRFSPTTATGLTNAKSGTLNVSASPGGAVSIPMTANARALLTLAATPPPTPPALDGEFGPVSVSSGVAASLTFTLTNNATAGGPSSGVITVAALGAPDPTQFTFGSGNGSSCVSGTTNLVAGGGSCTLVVLFKPSAPGPRASTLSVAGTAPTSTPSLALTGTATP